MEEPVTLDEIKADLRLDPEEAEQDTLLLRLIVAARRMVEIETRRTFGGDDPTLVGDDAAAGAQAVSAIVAHWFANPEAVADARGASAEVPLSARWIMDSLRKWDAGE